MSRPVVVSYGGGVNSTALLVGLHERGERPDLVLFADTGGERPETYSQVEAMSRWLADRGLPEVVTVRYDWGPNGSLEQECLTNGTLPSLAFGNKGCSVKWKRQPQERYLKAWEPARTCWDRGEKVRSLIGIDAGESHRGKFAASKLFEYEFPLIEWDWCREECLEACARAGLSPGKSACWFCPASRKPEVLALAQEHPELHERAVALERNAAPNLGVVRGLGRHWSWEQLVAADRAQLKLFPETVEQDCMCFDGAPE